MRGAVLSALLNGALVSTALAVAVAFAVRALKPFANASTRHGVWLAVLVVVAALPIVYLFLPLLQAIEPVSTVTLADLPIPADTRIPESVNLPPAVATSWFPLEIVQSVWTDWFLTAWLGVAALMLLRLCVSYFVLRRWKRKSSPSNLEALAPFWMKLCGSSRRVAVRVSGNIDVPVAAGPGSACILIPEGLARKMTPAQLEQI